MMQQMTLLVCWASLFLPATTAAHTRTIYRTSRAPPPIGPYSQATPHHL